MGTSKIFSVCQNMPASQMSVFGQSNLKTFDSNAKF